MMGALAVKALRNTVDDVESWTTKKRDVSSAKSLAFVVKPSLFTFAW